MTTAESRRTSETAIDKMRPKEAHAEALKLRVRCGRAFYRRYHTRFVETPCPSCSHEGTSGFRKFGYHHRNCPRCGTVWCSPRPSQDLLDEYYTAWEAPRHWTQFLLNTDNSRKTLQYRPRTESIVSVMKSGFEQRCGTAIDLGAGIGDFSLELAKLGYFRSILALDIAKECVDRCIERGLTARQASLADLDANSADLIAMNDFIEHVFSPIQLLDECRRVLGTGGFLSIATPNGEGFDFRIFKEKTVNVTPPEHLTYFNPKSIALLLERAGFEVMTVETPGILDVQIVIREVLENGYPLGRRNEFIEFLLLHTDQTVVDSFQAFLRNNHLSSHMLVLARAR